MCTGASGPVEAALLKSPFLLRRHLDVGWGEQEDLLGDLVHRSTQGVGGGPIINNKASAQLAVGGLQVDDHRLARLEAVADLLRVGEEPGGDHVHLGRLHRGDGPHHRRAGLGAHCLGDGGVVTVEGADAPCGHLVRLGVGALLHRARRRCRLLVVLVFVVVVVDQAEVDHRPADKRRHLSSSLLSGAYRSRDHPPGRGPNNARPSLTMVAPSATATSRSSVIPIETSSNPRRRASPASHRKPSRELSGGPGTPTAMRPSTRFPASRSPVTRSSTSPGGQPPRSGPPASLTSTSMAAAGAARVIAAASSRRSTDCHRCTTGANERTLLRCTAPRKCQRGPLTSAALASNSWA